jgi:hypothetical protein
MPIKTSKLLKLYTEAGRGKVLTSAALLLAAIILVDWIIFPGIPLGVFYILPILLQMGNSSRTPILYGIGSCLTGLGGGGGLTGLGGGGGVTN